MTQPLRTLLPGVLLACSLLSACGSPSAPENAASAPAAVDPVVLEAELEDPPAPLEVVVPDWDPQIEAVPKSGLRAAVRAAKTAFEAGRLLTVDSDPAAAPLAADEPAPEVVPEPGALEIYLSVLATEPDHEAANAGVEAIAAELVQRGRAALDEGRIADAERSERVLARARPQLPALASYRAAIESARRAQSLVQRGDARVRGGRIFQPADKSAVAAFRAALQAYPGYLPAQDSLARLQAAHLNQALASAQKGDYPASERWQAEAGRILPGSPALQDMAARIVELRQARTEELLAQGHAAVDALDLEQAAHRLSEAEKVSLQAQGLDGLSERIQLARHYGRFHPGQIFREPLAAGGEAPEMVVLAHGRFLMGSPETEAGSQESERPQHDVTFARGFALARNETTVADFRRFVVATKYRSLATRKGRSTIYDERGGVMGERAGVDWRRDHAGATAADALPVVHVAVEDAEAYVAWLSAQTGQRYRLPSEAEFEYALRGGRREAYAWGAGAPVRVVGNLTGDGDRSQLKRNWSNAIAKYSDGHWGPAPVRSYPAEALATFDLVGNVSEWVQDCWHDSYRRAPTDGSAWVNPGCEDRVMRGASWASTLDRARSAYRQPTPAGTTHARLGFRVVREL